MHPRTREILDYLEAQRATLKVAFDLVPAGRRTTAPATGCWSAAEIIEHLSIVNRRVVVYLSKSLAQARTQGLGPETEESPILPSLGLEGIATRAGRATAPEPTLPTGIGADEAWNALEQSGAAARQLLLENDGLALGNVPMSHPRFGEKCAYFFFGFLGAHEARHAAQIREMLSRLEAAEGATAAGSPS